MKKIFPLLFLAGLCFTAADVQAQIKNKKTVTAKVSGNCGMCKNTIEKAGTTKNISKVTWDATAKTATVVYDEKKTSADAILKKISLAGYDNEKYTAPNDVYDALHGCCKYDRAAAQK